MKATNNSEKLVEDFFSGKQRALAQIITLLENNDPEGYAIFRDIYVKSSPKYHVIGVTGPPGGGKSTLVDKIIPFYRKLGEKVGVLLVDPSSPFSGGALLGDRIRLSTEMSVDPNIYIRSMASRGTLGGITKHTWVIAELLGCFGFERIIIETVGAGQNEIDIVKFADCVLLLSVPGLGDDVQTIKSGIMEIGDIFVVNKSDTKGADITATALKNQINLAKWDGRWKPRVIKVVALDGSGVDMLCQSIEDHQNYSSESISATKNLERMTTYITESAINSLNTFFSNNSEFQQYIDNLSKKVLSREIDPISASEQIIKHMLKAY